MVRFKNYGGNPDEKINSKRRKGRVKKAAMILLEKFFDGLRENTIRRYKTVMTNFLSFCRCELKDVTEQDVMDFWDDVKSRNYGSMTERNLMRCLKSMFEYAKKRGVIKVNPFYTAAIRLPKENEKRKRFNAMVPFDKVLEFCNAPSKYTKDGIRDRAFLALLFGAGLRPSEAQNLRLKDVCGYETKNGATIIYLVIQDPKSRQPEEQPIPHWTAERVLRLIEQRWAEGADREDYLLVCYRAYAGKHSARIPYSTLGRLFRRYRDMCGLSKNVTLHSGRVTAISRLYDTGATLKQLQTFARHAYISTTERYIRLDESMEESQAVKLEYIN